MPIHDQGYRRYGGQRAPMGRAWWIIARTHMLAARSSGAFVILLLVSLVRRSSSRAVQIYRRVELPAGVVLAADTQQTFRDFLDQQGLFVFLVTIVTRRGLIADDRRANALQLYLSKPLTRVEYIARQAGAAAGAVCWA